jgi:hypothetical protein
MTQTILHNRIRCKKCNDIIESVHVHDFNYCKCGKVFVDGGREYGRFGFPGGNIEDWIEDLSEYKSE